MLGLTENCREGNSVYLRTWDDDEHHTIKLTAHDTSGIRRVGLRASSQQALEARVRAIEATGLGISWKDGDPGIGPTYLFRDPDGHELELYWETQWYVPPAELKPSLKNQAQAFPGRGVSVRRLDHVNYLAADVVPNGEFVRDVLGGRVTEQIMLDDGTISGQWLHFTSKGYDLVYTRDWTGSTGRLHHIAFAPDSREDILRAADISWTAACSSRPGRTSMRSSRPSSCTSTSPAVTGSNCATRPPGWCWHRTGARSSGPKPSAPRAKPGGYRPRVLPHPRHTAGELSGRCSAGREPFGR